MDKVQEQTDEIEVDSPTMGDSLDKCDEQVDISVRELLARQKRKGATSSSSSLGSKKDYDHFRLYEANDCRL